MLPSVGCYGLFPATLKHDDVIKWKHFPRNWPFVRGIHRSPVNSPHKGQWRGALMFTLICARINGWVNNREAGDLRRHRAHYDVIVMKYKFMDSLQYTYTCGWIQLCVVKIPTLLSPMDPGDHHGNLYQNYCIFRGKHHFIWMSRVRCWLFPYCILC